MSSNLSDNSMQTSDIHTTSHAILDALAASQVSFLFANFGSDHSALIEAVADSKNRNRGWPRVVICPNEMVALSAAHGHAMVSGKAQAVLVHVDCGTQALAGAVHNADRGRIPVLILAGMSPMTQEGEILGSRNEFIHWLQDTRDQRGIVRGYTRYDHEIRTGRNAGQIVLRALQFALSEPQGPAYLCSPREILEETVPDAKVVSKVWQPVSPSALRDLDALEIAAALEAARRPVIVTSYLGRNPKAVNCLTSLSERLGVGIIESFPSRLNCPFSHPYHLGTYWNKSECRNPINDADVVVVIDSDVPWIQSSDCPPPEARLYHIDIDPLKQQMSLWYLKTSASFRADPETALLQIHRALAVLDVDKQRVVRRKNYFANLHYGHIKALEPKENCPSQALTVEYLLSRLRTFLTDSTLVLNEAISNYAQVFDHLGCNKPGSIFTSGGSSLGWCGGASVGAKLASPSSEVISICGDGTFLFSVPTTVFWIARRYNTPFMQIVLNNGGWKSPLLSRNAVYPNKKTRSDHMALASLQPAVDYAQVAKIAGDGYGVTLASRECVDPGLREAFRVLRKEHRSVVVDVRLSTDLVDEIVF